MGRQSSKKEDTQDDEETLATTAFSKQHSAQHSPENNEVRREKIILSGFRSSARDKRYFVSKTDAPKCADFHHSFGWLVVVVVVVVVLRLLLLLL